MRSTWEEEADIGRGVISRWQLTRRFSQWRSDRQSDREEVRRREFTKEVKLGLAEHSAYIVPSQKGSNVLVERGEISRQRAIRGLGGWGVGGWGPAADLMSLPFSDLSGGKIMEHKNRHKVST